MTTPLQRCSCCGADIAGTDRVDYIVPLPDGAARTPDTDPNAAFLRLPDGRAFARCVLPVSLTGGTTLACLMWMEISEDDLRSASSAWRESSWSDQNLYGKLGNDLKPWNSQLRGVGVMAAVIHDDEPPTVVNSDDGFVRRILTETWDRDVVLAWFGDPLPVPVQVRVGRHWSIERGEGLAAGLNGRTWRFAGAGRSVCVEVLADDQGRVPGEFLAELLAGAPDVPPSQMLIRRSADCTTHAFWLQTDVDGRSQHDFYAHVVRRGTALGLGVFHTEPVDHAWAMHVLNSVRYHG